MIRVGEIKRRIGEPYGAIPEKAARKCGLSALGFKISEWKISRESVDARDKLDIKFVYAVDFTAEALKGSGGRGLGPEEEHGLVRRINARSKGAKACVVPDTTASASPGAASHPAAGGNAAEPGPVPAGAAQPKRVRLGIAGGNAAEPGTVPAKAAQPRRPRPIIAGFGPCGMFAALVLAEAGLEPIVLERGKPIEQRVADVEGFWNGGTLDPESNVQFGEGGAGTFSDGKLTTGIGGGRVRKVLEEFALAGGGEDLLYKAKPHIGTDVLRPVVKNIREKIISLGGSVLFQHRLDAIEAAGGALRGVSASSPGGGVSLPAEELVLALGHSARDSFRMLLSAGIRMERKPFSIGLRAEHPQALIDAAQYGDGFAGHYGMTPQQAGLPAAEYKLSHRGGDGRGIYTFCMCPGGRVIAAASSEGLLVSNGMSDRGRGSGFANSALLVDVRVDDFWSEHPLAGVDFQERFEGLAFAASGGTYCLPRESVGEFMAGSGLLAGCLPDFAARGIREGLPVFGKKLKGFDAPDAMLYGVETRSSSPVRIARAEGFEASIAGIYPSGEGAGYAGGIVSAAVDGIKVAEAIIARRMD